MIRRFNYTGRRRIERSDVSVTLRAGNNDVPEFDLNLNLARLQLPGSAKIYVEAYYRTSWMRFSCGIAEKIEYPPDRRLTEIDRGSTVYFRVLVVDETGVHGRIVASVDGIRPLQPGEKEDKRRSLLPVNLTDLGQEVWRLRFEPADPVLEVNNRIPEVQNRLQRDPVFLAMVYPAVIRQVLEHGIFVEGLDDDDEAETWQARWVRFSRNLVPFEVPSLVQEEAENNRELILDWIDQVARAFCAKFKVLDEFIAGESREVKEAA